jgi:ribonuclease HII
MNQKRYIIGIDEAGRGPLAGPVSIGLTIIEKDFYKDLKKIVKEIKGKDSKKLSHIQRVFWFSKIKDLKKNKKLDFHVALISSSVIDEKGIVFAIKRGMDLCLKKVGAKGEGCKVLLDGSLKAPIEFKNQKTIIKGDEKEPLISLASIAAKVTRDEYMKKISKKYQKYGFEVHKGYGTLNHRTMIKKWGISAIHRKSFLKKAL